MAETKNPPRDGVAGVRGQIDRLETALFDGTCRDVPDEAARRAEYAGTLATLPALFERLEDLDIANVVAWGDDRPGSAEVDQFLTVLWKRWLALADHAATRFGVGGLHAEGIDEVRRLIVEVKAFLNPSYVIAGKMLEFCEAAMAEHARGETLEGLVD